MDPDLTQGAARIAIAASGAVISLLVVASVCIVHLIARYRGR